MKITKNQIRKIILREQIRSNVRRILAEEMKPGIYADAGGYKFKVYPDGRIVLLNKDGTDGKEFTGKKKIEVAKNLVKDLQAKGDAIGPVLKKIAGEKSPAVDNSSKDVGSEWALGEAKVWLINYPDKKPATARAADILTAAVGDEAARKIKSVLDKVLPQGHGGVYLRKSDGTGMYYDFGCYYQRCGRGTEIELNFADQLVHDFDPTGKSFGVPGEVRRRSIPKNASKSSVESIFSSMNGGGTAKLYYAGETTNEDINTAIAKAEALYKKGCLQYSLIPRTSLGLAYNCGTFAITIATVAKTGSDAGGLIDRAVQYSQDAQPAAAIPPAAKTLSYL